MRSDYADSTIWTIGKLTQAVKSDASMTRVEIPKFQRHLVWNDQQKVDLIDSIHKGYPIGSLLLFKRTNPGGKIEIYHVVDGLQRTSTLIEYAEEPLKYVPVEAFPAESVAECAKVLDVEEEHVRRGLVAWMRATKRLTFLAGFAPNKCTKTLRAELDSPFSGGPEDDDPLDAILEPALDTLKNHVDISAVSIPVVTYSGPEGELPEIFERINQSGTKLNKYEVFAATWLSNSATHVASDDVRTAVNEKYQSLLNKGFNISGLESDKTIQDFNLFEYLFGMGKWLVKANPLLFKERADPAETEPAAFSVSCVVLGQQLARMAGLPEFMPRASDDLIDPTQMQNAIGLASQAVTKWLAPYTSLRLNAQSDATDIAHGELQMVSLIARAVVGRWNTLSDWSEKPDWQDDWGKLEQAIPQHYLMDLLEETWRGPIYTTLFNRVWQSEGEILTPSPHYLKPIEAKVWHNALDSWFDKQYTREQRSRPYVRATDRAFLRFVYSDLVSHQQNKQIDFELEHLFPVSRLKSLIGEEGPGWPISCIANLALFSKALNREKSKKTISEYLEGENALSQAELEMLNRHLLCDASDVSIPAGFDLGSYQAFLLERWTTMKSTLLSGLHVEESA